MKGFTKITVSEALAKLKENNPFHDGPMYLHNDADEDEDVVFYHDGDITVDSVSLDCGQSIFVNGNLTVNGILVSDEYTELMVTGTIRCQHAFIYCNACIGGDFIAEGYINSESLCDFGTEVGGIMRANFIMNQGHGTTAAAYDAPFTYNFHVLDVRVNGEHIPFKTNVTVDDFSAVFDAEFAADNNRDLRRSLAKQDPLRPDAAERLAAKKEADQATLEAAFQASPMAGFEEQLESLLSQPINALEPATISKICGMALILGDRFSFKQYETLQSLMQQAAQAQRYTCLAAMSTTSIRLRPKQNLALYTNTANAYLDIGMPVIGLETALPYLGRRLRAEWPVVAALRDLGLFDAALYYCDQALDESPDWHGLSSIRASLLNKLERYDEVTKMSDAEMSEGDAALLAVQKAVAFAHLGNDEKFTEHMSQAIITLSWWYTSIERVNDDLPESHHNHPKMLELFN